jgi:hypothetical protein
MAVQVFLLARSAGKDDQPIRIREITKTYGIPGTPWLDIPDDEYIPCEMKDHHLTVFFGEESAKEPVRNPIFRFPKAAPPDPLIADRPPPLSSA